MKKNKGFTLVEVIVILVILAILAAVLIPSLTTYIDKARQKNIESNARAAYVATQALMSEAYGKDANFKKNTFTSNKIEVSEFSYKTNASEAATVYTTYAVSPATGTVLVTGNQIIELAQLTKVAGSTGTDIKISFSYDNQANITDFVYTEGPSGNTKTVVWSNTTGAWIQS